MGFDTAVLYFFFVAKKGDEDVVKQWEKAAQKVVTTSNKYKHLSAGMTSNNLIAEEVKRMGSETAPMIVGSIAFTDHFRRRNLFQVYLFS